MKAVVVYEPGSPDVLKYTDVPTPKVKPGWSLVKIKGFGIIHSEIFTRQGKSPSVKFPRILGIECVGVVDQTTDETRLPEGTKVISMNGEMGRDFDGSYAEYALLPNDQIHPVTTNLSWEDLAAVPETYHTAYRALLQLQIDKADSLLIRGGTSGVGIAAMKLARAINPQIKVTGTSRHEVPDEVINKLKYDRFVLDDNQKLKMDYQVDRILDLVGAATAIDSMNNLKPFGIASITGNMGGVWDIKNFDPVTAIPNDRYMTSFASYTIDEGQLNDLLHLIEEKHVDVHPVKIFKLNQLPEAHRFLENQTEPGKVVVLP
ncbi:zinc-binding dehydrogenase [Companilactobacillus kimchii]|uniref:Zinc-containing alcohol dehydrogenase superfamily protein n=2 Tax=Companilactobacillus kimchii TaxID=2801452 RepID=A0ABR5NVX9_9LACO|nr:zinc-binding dehydrogenase [Companilactobacillus kimchii]KAE9558352.1 quinone oxidoreductase [Companilactobacillus kimchii]KRK52922.1 zinc-containing alcohol dehydrogenase superfamily protein [Companilactobacillus kimchii DSM 13961 = JCM 10707]OWF33051.1 NADPH:quinone reductase [Companilactobacillus kimchii]GEO47012.1 quinone oxidoreductase [Companilactobacillus paralimentarius]